MLELNLPTFNPALQKDAEKGLLIKCLVRKRFLVLTPEEWVRQHFIHYLASEKAVSMARMAVEKQLDYHGLKKRTDLVVYSQLGSPILLVECKAPHISLGDGVRDQIATYNSQIQVPYLCITNGLQHLCYKWINSQFMRVELQELLN